MRPNICVPQTLHAWRWIVADASITWSLSPFSRTVTFSRGTTATTEKIAPSGFQHFVQPQAWLWATSPLMPTLTGRSLHLQTRVPEVKLPEPFLTPLSRMGGCELSLAYPPVCRFGFKIQPPNGSTCLDASDRSPC